MGKGVKTASTLAKTVTQAFVYFKENASKQCHYDFGMRALKSFVECMGIEKKANPETCENQIFMNTWDCMIVSKLTPEDCALSEKYFEDIFPGLKPTREIPECFKSEPNAEKLTLLEKLLSVRHSVGIISKDKNNNLFKRYAEIKNAEVETVELKNSWDWPNENVDMVSAYGEMKGDTYEDGVVVKAYRKLQGSKNDLAVLLFAECRQGSPVVMENLNSVMDDNKVLRLEGSFEELRLNDNVRLVFELE